MALPVALLLTLDVPRKWAPIRVRPYVDYPLLNTLCMTACCVHPRGLHTHVWLCALKKNEMQVISLPRFRYGGVVHICILFCLLRFCPSILLPCGTLVQHVRACRS